VNATLPGEDVPVQDTRPRFPVHLRIAAFALLLILSAIVILAAGVSLFLTVVAWFFWGWEGWKVLPAAFLALGVAVGAALLSAALIRKVDRLSKTVS